MKSGFDFKYTASGLTFIFCSQDCHQIPMTFIKVVCQVLVWHTLSDAFVSIETVHTHDSTSTGIETGIPNSYDSNLS